MAKTTHAEAKNIKRIKYPWKSDLKNSLRMFLWKPIIANKTAAGNKNNCRYSPRVPSGLLQPGANFSKNIPVIPNNKENTKNMIITFFENNSDFPLLHNNSTIIRVSHIHFAETILVLGIIITHLVGGAQSTTNLKSGDSHKQVKSKK